MANNQIRFNVGFNIDRTGLNELQNSLAQVQIAASRATGTSQMEQDLRAAGQAASQLSDILNQSWNSRLGQLDLSRVNNSIKQTYGSVSNLKDQMARSGPVGVAAYNQVASAILNTNLQLKQSNKLLDEMATSMANTVKWGITAGIFNKITQSIQQAFSYTKKLDSSLNDIRIVTDKSAESMEKFAVQANKAAKNLGASTMDYTQASLIYYQQGLDDTEVAARAETTLKAANVTGQNGAEVSEQLTAVWNGYKVTAEETELYIDKLAAVAATTAADLEELSVGMSKVASAANIMGVDIDQLNAQLATIVSVTREAPESIGTALKTVYARMSDIVAGMDGEVSLDEYTKQMATMGINVLDANNNLRDMGEVVEEIGGKWTTLTREQQTSLAQTIAGTRQYSRMMSLFDNWDMYTKALETSSKAAGTLQHQQDIFTESTKAHLQQLKTESERTYDILFNQDTVNGFADTLTGALGIFNNFIESIGGGGKAIIYFGSLVANVFNQQIAKAIQGQIRNFEVYKNNMIGKSLKSQIIDTFTGAATGPTQEEITRSAQLSHASRGEMVSTKAVAEEARVAKEILKVEKALTAEQHSQLIEIQRRVGLNAQEIEDIKSYKTVFKDILKDENASFEIARAHLEGIGNELREQRNSLRQVNDLYRNSFNQNNQYTGNNQDMAQDRLILEQEIARLRNSPVVTQQQIQQLDQLTRESGELALSEENIRAILGVQNQQLVTQRQNYSLLNSAIDNMALDESGRTQELREQNAELTRQVNQETQLAQRQINIGRGVQGAMAAVGTLTAVSGGLGTVINETSSEVEKINAWGSIVSGAAMSIGMAFGPIGMVIGGVVSAISTAVSSTLAKNKQKLEEDIAETRKKWEELRSDIKKSNSDIDSLDSLSTEFERLSLGVTQYGENVSLTTEEYEQYKDIVEQIVGISPEVVEGYTKEGEAIVNNNGLIERTIELLKEQQEEKKKLLLTDDNMDTTYEMAKSDYQKADKKINEAKENEKTYLDDIESEYGISLRTIAANDFNFEEIQNKLSDEQIPQFQKDTEHIRNLMSNDEGVIEIGLITKNREKIESALKELEETYKLSSEDIWKNSGWDSTTDAFFKGLDDRLVNTNDGLAAATESVEVATKQKEQATKALNDKVLTWIEVYDSNYKEANTEQQLAIQKYIDSFSTEVFNDDVFDDFNTKALEFSNSLAKLDEDVSEKINDIFDLKETGKYQDYIDAVIQFFKDQAKTKNGLTEDEIMQLFGLTAFSVKDNTITDEITEKGDQIEKTLQSRFGKDFNIEDYFSGKDILNADGLTISGINFDVQSFEEFESLYSRFTINNAVTEAMKSFTQIQTNITAINDGLKEFQQEGQMSEKTISDLERRYPQLAEIQKKNSHEYLQTLREIREQEENNARESLEEQKKALKEKAEYYNNLDYSKLTEIQIKADTEEFEKTMQQLSETEYKIQVQVEADLKTDVEDAFGLADELSKLQDLVPEDLTVSFQEAQELIEKGYAGILENATETSEQSIKLDKATMNAFIDNRQAELEEDRKNKIAQLENQKTLLITQREVLIKKLNALKEAKNAENAVEAVSALQKAKMADAEYQDAVELLNATLGDKANAATEEEKINEQLFNDLGGMYETNSKNEQQSEKDTTDNQAENVKSRLNNIKQLYDGYMAVAEARLYSEGAGGEPSKTVPGADSVTGGSAPKTTTPEKAKGEEIKAGKVSGSEEEFTQNVQDLYNNQQEYENTVNKLIEDTESQIDGLDQQIGSIDAGIAALKSADKSLDKAQKEAGSGSGDKEERDEEYKDKDEEIDRYWELNKAIEKVSEALSDLDKKQSKLHGKELIASLKQENKLLEQQAEAYRALAAEQQKEASELQAALSAYGVVFDAQGGIANYLAASQSALDTYNQAVAAYNAFLIDEATFQAAQRAYENFKSQLERYEALYYEEMVDTQNKLDDIRTKELENNLEAWEIKLQLQLDFSEAKREWKNFLREINEDFTLEYKETGKELRKILANTKSYTSNGNTRGTIPRDIKAIEQVEAEIDKIKNGKESDMFSSISEAQEKLKELNEKLKDDAAALYQLYQDAWDAYMEGIDQSAEKFDNLMGQFERIDEELEFQKELIELTYGDKAYDLFDKLYEAQERNSLAQIDSLVQQKDMWYQMWQEAEEGSAERAKYYDLWTEAEKKLNDQTIKHIKLLQDEYMNTVKSIIEELEAGLTGGSSMEEISEEWDRIKEKSDKYLDNVEGLYEIQTLANKINNSIAETSSLKNQQKLQKLYDKEIKHLREKEDLTKYDLEAAEARYQIALKEIALEDARNAKNSMKLTKGTDGNWSYQYVADEDAISKAQQDLLDANNKSYQLANEAYERNLEEQKELTSKYVEDLLEIENDKNLNDTEKKEKKLKLEKQYLEDQALLQKENELIKMDLKTTSSGLLLNLYNTDKENFKNMTIEEQNLVRTLKDNNILDFMALEDAVKKNYDNIGIKAETVLSKNLASWTSGAQKIIDLWSADDGKSVQAKITEAMKKISIATDGYNEKMKTLADTAKKSFGKEGIEGAIEGAEKETKKLEDDTAKMVKNMTRKLNNYKKIVNQVKESWLGVKDAIVKASKAASEYIKEKPVPAQQPKNTPTPVSSNTGSVTPTPVASGGGDGVLNVGDTAIYTGGSYYVDSYGTGPGKNRGPNKPVTVTQIVPGRAYPIHVYSTDSAYGWLKQDQLTGYDTGGYTGDWEGKDGKLAFLHSKELVLNSEDTKNILDAVNTVRNLSNLSSSIENMIAKNLNNMIMKMSNIGINSSYNVNKEEKNVTENIFHVTAEFPNANDVNSIKEAFLSLPNIVSQYIAENKK